MAITNAKVLELNEVAARVAQASSKLLSALQDPANLVARYGDLFDNNGALIASGITTARAEQLSQLVGGFRLLDNTIVDAINELGALRGQFFDDLLAGVTDVNHICNNVEQLTPGRVRAWKDLDGLLPQTHIAQRTNMELLELFSKEGVTDVVSNFNDLLKGQFFDNLLDNFPNKLGTANVEIVQAASKEQYLDYLLNLGSDLEDYLFTFRLYDDAQGRSWKAHLSWMNNSNTWKVGLPGFEGKTYEEVIDLMLQSGQYNNLNRSDAFKAFSYTTGYFYNRVNNWIRNGEELALSQSIMSGVIPSLQKLPKYGAGTTFYRGIKVEAEDLPAFLNKYVTGANVPENFIQSVATRIEDSFIGRPGYNVEFEIVGKIDSPSEARNIHDFAWAKYWNTSNPNFPRTLSEGFFLPSARLRVKEVLPPQNNVYKFILEEY